LTAFKYPNRQHHDGEEEADYGGAKVWIHLALLMRQ
jgi:hypothetical protein